MKLFPYYAIVGLLAAGCASPTAALMFGGPGAMQQVMGGYGTMLQRPDGTQGFRFAIQTNKHDTTPDDSEKLRQDALAQWIGNKQSCTKGYIIDSREVVKATLGADNIIYEGHCK